MGIKINVAFVLAVIALSIAALGIIYTSGKEPPPITAAHQKIIDEVNRQISEQDKILLAYSKYRTVHSAKCVWPDGATAFEGRIANLDTYHTTVNTQGIDVDTGGSLWITAPCVTRLIYLKKE
jgi:hypothetical protein